MAGVGFSSLYFVFFDITIPAETNSVKPNLIKKHYINEKTSILVTETFAATPVPLSVTPSDLINSFSFKVLKIIDPIAALNIKVLSGKKTMSWKNIIQVIIRKRACRQE